MQFYQERYTTEYAGILKLGRNSRFPDFRERTFLPVGCPTDQILRNLARFDIRALTGLSGHGLVIGLRSI